MNVYIQTHAWFFFNNNIKGFHLRPVVKRSYKFIESFAEGVCLSVLKNQRAVVIA